MALTKDRKFKHFVKQFVPRIYFLCEITSDIPPDTTSSGVVNAELIDIFCRAIFVKMNVYLFLMTQFLRNHASRMEESAKLFVTYVLFVCKTFNDEIRYVYAYECFISVISVIMGLTATCYHSGNREFVYYTESILFVCFENMLKEKFYQNGGWKNLGEYALKQEYMQYYDTMVTGDINIYDNLLQDLASLSLNSPFSQKLQSLLEDDVESDIMCIQLAEEIMSSFSKNCLWPQLLSKIVPNEKGSLSATYEFEAFERGHGFNAPLKEVNTVLSTKPQFNSDSSPRNSNKKITESTTQEVLEKDKSTCVQDEKVEYTLSNKMTASVLDNLSSGATLCAEIKSPHVPQPFQNMHKYDLLHNASQFYSDVHPACDDSHYDSVPLFPVGTKSNKAVDKPLSSNDYELLDSAVSSISKAKSLFNDLNDKLLLLKDMLDYLSKNEETEVV